jgi:hypothetical protein
LIFLLIFCLDGQSQAAEFRCFDKPALGQLKMRERPTFNDNDPARYYPREEIYSIGKEKNTEAKASSARGSS